MVSTPGCFFLHGRLDPSLRWDKGAVSYSLSLEFSHFNSPLNLLFSICDLLLPFSVPSVANLIFNNQSYLTNNQLLCRPLRASIEWMPIFCISWAIVLPTPGICSNSCKLDHSIERFLRYYSPLFFANLVYRK